MSISYEEALSTLEAMFGSWTREDLDTILRYQKGHMENTVDLILRHGDQDPQILVHQIEQGVDPEQATTDNDAELARQLSNQGRNRRTNQPQTTQSRKGRGTPTTLPEDFLRIPGVQTSTPVSQLTEDEQLARMLQDELFSEELRRNPEFAHLGRSNDSRRNQVTSGGRPVGSDRTIRGNPQSPNFMKQITDLGDNAKRRLQLLAAQFNSNVNRNNPNAPDQQAASSAERRGLLDGDGDETYELASRKDL